MYFKKLRILTFPTISTFFKAKILVLYFRIISSVIGDTALDGCRHTAMLDVTIAQFLANNGNKSGNIKTTEAKYLQCVLAVCITFFLVMLFIGMCSVFYFIYH